MRAPTLQPDDILRIAEDVINDSREMPADTALRRLLKGRGFSQKEKETITRHVFAYYRWLKWVDGTSNIKRRLHHAVELQQAFAADPGSIGEDEILEKAVPEWVHSQARLSPATLREFQQEPRLWLRARRGEAARVAEELGDCEAHPTIPEALWFRGHRDLFQSGTFLDGLFEIQDLSSQCVGLLCAPRPGETWWDACAGEGGKTLHLADQMENRGMIWATDRAQWRLDKLKRRAARAKIYNYRSKHWVNPSHLPLRARVDGLLVDAPCSGLGTWGRNPHMRWTVSGKDVAELAAVQANLLSVVAGSVKPGGRLIYSVCTLSHAETEKVADGFDQTHPEFSRLDLRSPAEEGSTTKNLWLNPEDLQANGMYVAAWQRS